MGLLGDIILFWCFLFLSSSMWTNMHDYIFHDWARPRGAHVPTIGSLPCSADQRVTLSCLEPRLLPGADRGWHMRFPATGELRAVSHGVGGDEIRQARLDGEV